MDKQGNHAIILFLVPPLRERIRGILQEYFEPLFQNAPRENAVVPQKGRRVFGPRFVEPCFLPNLANSFFLVIGNQMGELVGKETLEQRTFQSFQRKIHHFALVGVRELKLQVFIHLAKISFHALCHAVRENGYLRVPVNSRVPFRTKNGGEGWVYGALELKCQKLQIGLEGRLGNTIQRIPPILLNRDIQLGTFVHENRLKLFTRQRVK